RPEHLEIVAGNKSSGQLATAREHELRALGAHIVEQIGPASKLLKCAPAESPALRVFGFPTENVKAIRIAHRKRTEHVCVKYCEYDRDEPEPDRKREHGRCRARAALSEDSKGRSDVGEELVEPQPRPRGEFWRHLECLRCAH